MTVKTFSFPLVTTPKQVVMLRERVLACWRLRNYLVEERARNRKKNKVRKTNGEKTDYLTRADQYADIANYMRRDIGMAKVHSQVRQNVAVRVDEGYKRFFDALNKGRTNVHPPKTIESKYYKSITYPQYGPSAHIRNSTLHLSRLGEFRLIDYRKIKGKPKTVTVKFKKGRWWAAVSTEIQKKDVYPVIQSVDARIDGSLDPGLANLLNDSEGNVYDPPRAFKKYQGRLRTEQKKMSRQFEERKKNHKILSDKLKSENKKAPALRETPYSNRLKKQIKVVAKLHTKVENVRDCHHKKNASIVEGRFTRVAVEEHPVQFMLKNRRLAKAAADRAIHKQKLLLKNKLGDRYIEAESTQKGLGGNSQICVCGASVPKKLEDRVHVCTSCGIVAKRDHMSANVILVAKFGFASLSLRTQVPATGQVVVIRGEDKALYGESCLRELQNTAASESSVKRIPPAQGISTTGAEATVKGKTTVHRKAKRRRALTVEPSVAPAAVYRRARSLKNDKALNLGI